MNILIRNATVLPMTASESSPNKYFTGDVGISGDRILFVGPVEAVRDQVETFRLAHAGDLRELDATGQVLMPGLINLHNHVSMTLLRGYADDMALMPWLTEKIWPFEGKMDGEDVYLGAQLGIAEMLLGGTTSFVDMYWHFDRVVEAATELGIRGVICPTFIESGYDAVEASTIEILQDMARRRDDRVCARIAPHAPYTCPPAIWKRALALCERFGIGIHTHVSETQDEQQIICQTYDKTPTEYLRDLGVFEYPTLAAHCIYLSESDMEIMARKEVCVAHNPQSNMKLASGVAPVAEMLRRGLTVGFGTDGPSSNNDLDLWEEMRTGSLLQKVSMGNPTALTAYQTLQMATVGGARALGLAGELGVVAPGAKADLLLVNASKAHLMPCHDLVANLVYAGKSADVDTVIVDGRILVEGGELLGVDLPALYDRAQERVGIIAAR